MTQISDLISELAETGREVTDTEIRQIRDHVARAGFDPDARERVRGRGAGVYWRGRVLRGSDQLPPAEAHYVRHVLGDPEWPAGTSLTEYLESIFQIVLDNASGVFLSFYQDNLQIGFMGRSKHWKGPEGGDWILVDYRLRTERIVTAFQIETLEDATSQAGRRMVRWLRNPQ